MSACRPGGDFVVIRQSVRWLAALALTALPAWADPPARVVSINLCTDQLAMLVAAPGQLISVSHLAHDPHVSAMVAKAADYPANHGLAEDILRLRPDLVLALDHAAPVTVAMLERLGIPVVTFPPENDLAGIRDNLHRMGRALGQEVRAREIVAEFDADLAALSLPSPAPRPRAALYAANGYSGGEATLAGAILSAAGLANVAGELGLSGGGFLALERLVMADPDLIVTARPYPGASRAEEVLAHPALRAMTARQPVEAVSDSDWVCGTPHVLDAVARLRQAAR